MRTAIAGILALLCCWILLSQKAFSQMKKVTGAVITAEGQPLQGASVTVRGRSSAAITDAGGRFSIEAGENDKLLITFIGFTSMEVEAGRLTSGPVVMKPDIRTTDEVVVIGYGAVRKSSLTGAVAKLRNDNLQQIPVSRPDLALQGKMAGVQITTTDAQAGAAPTIQVRGAASITATSNPLIVIDGYPVPTDLSAVDMNDVASVEVLKDAASAAIYGSRGANGVILITTKSGKTGKARISFNVYAGFKEVYRKLDLGNLDNWIKFAEADNKGALSDQLLTAQRFNVNTDPQDIVFQTGAIQNYALNIQGGSETVKYFVSGAIVKDKGVIIKNNYDRYTVRANIDIKATPRLDIGFNVNPSYTIQDELPLKIHDALRTISPWMPLYHNDSTARYTGKPVGSYVHQRDFDPARNPVYQATGLPSLSATSDNNGYTQIMGQTRRNYETRILANAYASYKFTEALSFRTSFGAFSSNKERESYRASWARVDILNPQTTADQARANTFGQNTQTALLDLLNENLLTYKKRSGLHDINAVAGFTMQSTKGKKTDIQANNFATDEIKTLNAGTILAASTTREENNLLSALFRINYAYADKYIFSLASRWDGSSRFGPDNRRGYFPSASAAWRISQENFLKSSHTLSDLKLRLSYGATGNNNIGNYRYFANVTPVAAVFGSNALSPGFTSGLYANNDLGWERTFSFNTGLDAGFWNDRLSVTLDYYKATTDKLLLYLPIPYITGTDGYWINQGKVDNKGFEIELSGRIADNRNFKWDVTIVGAHNENKLASFGNRQQLISTGDPKRNNYFLAQVGQPLVQFYGYERDSAVSLQGSSYWPIGVTAERTFVKDLNGDGVINEKDRVILGSPYPDFTWGMTQTLRYKDLDLSFVLQGSHGAEIYNIDPNYYENQFNSTAVNAHLKYSPELQSRVRYKTESDYNVQDASFIALRSVNIGYTLPASITGRWRIRGLRVYLTANNLWYRFAGNYTSLNPEGINEFEEDPLRRGYQRGAAPVTRTLAAGINLDL